MPTSFIPEQQFTVKLGATFHGRDNLIESSYVLHTDSEILHGDRYEAWIQDGPERELVAIGESERSHSLPGASYFAGKSEMTYSRSPVEVRFPFALGNRWSGGSAYRLHASGDLGVSDGRVKYHNFETRNTDGSYETDLLNFPIVLVGHTVRDHIAVDARARAISSIIRDRKAATITIGVPRVQKSGTYAIPLAWTLNGFDGTIPDWYPGGGAPPSPLDSATMTDRGRSSLPPVCAVPRSIATSGEAIELAESHFDPTGVVQNFTQRHYYADGIGVVCVVYQSRAFIYDVLPPRARLVAVLELHEALFITQYKGNGAMGVEPRFGAAGATLVEAAAQRRAVTLRDLRRKVLAHLHV